MQPTPTTTTAPRVLAARPRARRTRSSAATLAGWIHRRRVLASVTFLVLRDRSGLAQVVVKDRDTVEQLAGLPEETVVEVTGTVSANESAPGGAELVEPAITALTEPALAPPTELWRPTLRGRAADAPRPRRGDPAPPAPPGCLAARERVDARLPCGARARSSSPRSRPRSSSAPPPSRAPTSSPSTTSGGRPTSRRARSSTSRCSSGSSSGSSRSARSSAPSRTTPCATSRSTPRSTPSSASSATTATCWRSCARRSPAWSRRIREHAGDAAALLAVELPRVPEEFPVIHFSDALAKVGADPDEPDLSPAHERALSEWAKAAYGSDFLAVEGYPMAQAALLHAPAAG